MKVRIKTLTPLHIGGKEGALLPMEYVIFNQKCYCLSEERLSRKLLTQNQLDSFLVAVQGKDFSVKQFLKQKGYLSEDFLASVSLYHSNCNLVFNRETIRPFARNAYSQAFIPGTSIKGVLRTAIMYAILQQLDDSTRKRLLDDFVKDKLREYKKDPRGERGYKWFQEKFKQWFAQRLDQEVFQKFILQEQQRRYDPHTDILRALKISDSTSVDRDSLSIEEIKIFSAQSNMSPKSWSIYAECIPEGVELEFELKVDQGILKDFEQRNRDTRLGLSFAEIAEIINHPLETANSMAQELYQKEKEFFEKELRCPEVMEFQDEPNFRLGWGSGLLGTSMGMLLPLQIRQDLRNTLFHDRRHTPAPKSRRVVMRGNQGKLTLGWVRAFA